MRVFMAALESELKVAKKDLFQLILSKKFLKQKLIFLLQKPEIVVFLKMIFSDQILQKKPALDLSVFDICAGHVRMLSKNSFRRFFLSLADFFGVTNYFQTDHHTRLSALLTAKIKKQADWKALIAPFFKEQICHKKE